MKRRRPLSRTSTVASLALLLIVVANLPGRPSQPHVDRWISGDIIFLNGTSIRSKVVRLLQGYSTDYSHVGIIVVEDGVPFVVHADPAEGKVVRQRWDALLGSGDVSGGAVYRVRCADAAGRETACEMAQGCVAKGVPFDNDFDLRTADRFFCTELVLRTYRQGGVDLCENAETQHPHLLPANLISTKLEAIDRF